MKLFQCNYLENNDDETYLTVGLDTDTEDIIKERELNSRDDWNCLYFFGVREITEVNGHKITIE